MRGGGLARSSYLAHAGPAAHGFFRRALAQQPDEGAHAREAAGWRSAGTVGAAEPAHFRAAVPAPTSAAPLFKPMAEREGPDEIDCHFGVAP